MKKHLRRLLSLPFALCLLLAACGTPFTPTSESIPVTLKIFAASSLKDALGEIKTNYKAVHDNVTLAYVFDNSQILEQQLANGAAADIFAAADQPTMQKARDADLIGNSQVFAKNKLVVIVPRNNPARIYTLKDLATTGVKIDIGDPSIPIGNAALQALTNLGTSTNYGPGYEQSVKTNIVSGETTVGSVIQKVQSGEVDAGIVYQTDITPALAKQVVVIDIPTNLNVVTQYPIAVTKHAAHANDAQTFVRYLLSSDGQAVLTKYHFITVNK